MNTPLPGRSASLSATYLLSKSLSREAGRLARDRADNVAYHFRRSFREVAPFHARGNRQQAGSGV